VAEIGALRSINFPHFRQRREARAGHRGLRREPLVEMLVVLDLDVDEDVDSCSRDVGERKLYLGIQKLLRWNECLHDVLDLRSGIPRFQCARV